MIKLLIIADDFTGALDTGVKFAEAGAATKVMTRFDDSFVNDDSEVLVLCIPTRHIPYQEAYDQVKHACSLASGKVGCIFKKTDSALRGNVGAELAGALDGSGLNELYFVPALPGMKRFTNGGVHFINGVRVRDSVFGRDPFEPVTESYIPELMHKQCKTNIESVWEEDAIAATPKAKGEPTIFIYDCDSVKAMEQEAEMLCKDGIPKLVAGCSGLAQALVPYFGFKKADDIEDKRGALVVICGSVNPISSAQMVYAEKKGYSRIHLTGGQLLDEESKFGHLAQGLVMISDVGDGLIIDTLNAKRGLLGDMSDELREELRDKISRRAGTLIKEMCDKGLDSRLLIIGGDTLLAFAGAIDCTEFYPVCEMQPGVVLFKMHYNGKDYEIMSKSGGFGEEDLIVKLGRVTNSWLLGGKIGAGEFNF